MSAIRIHIILLFSLALSGANSALAQKLVPFQSGQCMRSLYTTSLRSHGHVIDQWALRPFAAQPLKDTPDATMP